MTADASANRLALGHLCGVIAAGGDVRTLFQRAAEGIQQLTDCGRVTLYLAPDRFSGHARLVSDFTNSPGCFDARDLADPPLRVQHLLNRPPSGNSVLAGSRVEGQGQSAVLYLSLVSNSATIGVLEIAGRSDRPVGHCNRDLLEELGTILALGLNYEAARARIAELERFQRERTYLQDRIKVDQDLRALTGESQAMKTVRLAIQQAAPADSTVLILGETGTGKELVARAIHQLSPRRDHLLVAVNCAALAPGVIASELFGHEQGAFTGAIRRRLGRFELAHRGKAGAEAGAGVSAECLRLASRG